LLKKKLLGKFYNGLNKFFLRFLGNFQNDVKDKRTKGGKERNRDIERKKGRNTHTEREQDRERRIKKKEDRQTE